MIALATSIAFVHTNAYLFGDCSPQTSAEKRNNQTKRGIINENDENRNVIRLNIDQISIMAKVYNPECVKAVDEMRQGYHNLRRALHDAVIG